MFRVTRNGETKMGLAASQARFLGITARKSNIEYEGQQVNQQRTALAEEVNSLYSKLLALDVPVAPDATKYYETDYSFSVTSSAGYDGDYLIKSYYQNDDGTYHVNATRSYKKNVAVGTQLQNASISKGKLENGQVQEESEGDEDKIYLTTPDGVFELTQAQNAASMISLINSTYGEDTITDEQLYFYKDNNGVSHYIDKAVIDSWTESEKEPKEESNEEKTKLPITSYISDNKDVTENIVFESATLTLDANGRVSGISATDPTTSTSLFSNAEVDTERVYDQEGYDAALRDYTMSKDEYDKMVADLNAQTESLQEQDKVLELRLNQIDTEQQELKTELDAIKEVLKNNIESTFKTFS